MKSRLLLASAAMHAGLILGVAAWVSAGAPTDRPAPPRLAFRPSEPVVAWTETHPPRAEFDLRPTLEPDSRDLPEPTAWPLDPPPAAAEEPVRAEPTWPPLPTDPLVRVRPPAPPPPAASEAAATEVATPEPLEPPAEPPPPENQPRPQAAFVEARALDGRNLEPDYPRRARQLGWTGTVTLRLSIDEFGRVVDARIVAPCAHPILNRAALRAVREWSFEPARRDGVAVASEKDTSVEFRLRNR